MRRLVPRLVHDLVLQHATEPARGRTAIAQGDRACDYASVIEMSRTLAHGLVSSGVRANDRVAIYLGKSFESVVAMFGASLAGAVFVPINPVLKAEQVRYILQDSEARLLLTSEARIEAIRPVLASCPSVRTIVLTDAASGASARGETPCIDYHELLKSREVELPLRLENDIAALLYTSGSTGRPKGVVLSHRNVVVGALSVAEYLENSPDDTILSILPLSFDAGMSQVTTAFAAGARVVLLDYLLAFDVVRTCSRFQVTGITGVPPLWMQLMDLSWPESATRSLRYFANTGGKMPRATLDRLRAVFPGAKPFLMYGLTEAFRSTYLPPEHADRIPDSIGKAIPNAEILIVRPDGTPCDADEPGELVHRGPLVSLGYWKDPERTRERFRPAPGQPAGLPNPELAVWSGDLAVRDADGFLYFVGRADDMIKSSGYRISPTEVEEIAFTSGLVNEAAAVGIADDRLGQRVVLVAKAAESGVDTERLLSHFRAQAPAYMVPVEIVWTGELPRSPNGKLDRRRIAAELETLRRSAAT